MTDLTGDTDRPGGLLDIPLGGNRGDFRAANRHTTRVRLLRRAIISGTVLTAALVAVVMVFDPFRSLPISFSIGQVGVEGTKITMDLPKLTGFQKDGRGYEVRALRGLQDITTPNVIELVDLDSKVQAADGSTVRVTASNGIYDSVNDKMTMTGVVRIQNPSGYDIRMKSALMNFKTGGLVTQESVSVLIDGGTIAAGNMDISDNGHKISFDGGVKSQFDTDSKSGDPPQAEAAR